MPFIQLQFRRGNASQWTSANPVLAEGEMGIELDTDRFKIGDGTTAWNSLPYGGLQGPQGDPGPEGDPGPQGPPGANPFDTFTITKTLTLNTDWQDTGIKGTDLTTGTYILQLFANDTGAGGTNSNEYYSGNMSWYSGATNGTTELPSDEIPLHRAGGGGSSEIYLRTFRSPTGAPDDLKLQIYSNIANTNSSNYVFKFIRII